MCQYSGSPALNRVKQDKIRANQFLMLFQKNMARPDREKCRLCSKLSSQETQARHGKTGDFCWDDKKCHNRRSYYRHRGIRNHTRKQQRRNEVLNQARDGVDRATTVTIDIPVPAIPAAVVHWYRETKDSPLHALRAELWVGNDRVAKIEPVQDSGGVAAADF
jgi:hypothetical protein